MVGDITADHLVRVRNVRDLRQPDGLEASGGEYDGVAG